MVSVDELEKEENNSDILILTDPRSNEKRDVKTSKANKIASFTISDLRFMLLSYSIKYQLILKSLLELLKRLGLLFHHNFLFF